MTDNNSTNPAIQLDNSDGVCFRVQDAGNVYAKGNVGIGTTAPSAGAKFEVSSNDATTYAGNQGDINGIVIRNDNTTNNNYSMISFMGYDGNSSEMFGNIGVLMSDHGSGTGDGSIVFNTFNNNTNAEVMRIQYNGNVGIGTTAPAADLHVSEAGADEVRIQMTNSATGDASSDGFAIVMAANGTHTYLYNYESGGHIILGTNNATRMTINGDGDILPGANNTQDLGSDSLRWANLYIADIQLSNKDNPNEIDGTSGTWTIQEGDENLFVINRITGKKFKINLTEVV